MRQGATSEIIIRGLVSNGNNAVNVRIGGEAEFKMSLGEMAVPDDVTESV